MNDDGFEARLQTIFDQFDEDGGGSIDTAELGNVMETLGQHCTEAELLDIVNEVDHTGSGEISFDDFHEMFEAASGADAAGFQTTLIESFAYYDDEKLGYLTEEQLKAVTTNLGETLGDDDIATLVAKCKENGWVVRAEAIPTTG